MNAHGSLALGIDKDLDGIKRIGVHGGKRHARIVRADGDQAQIKGPA